MKMVMQNQGQMLTTLGDESKVSNSFNQTQELKMSELNPSGAVQPGSDEYATTQMIPVSKRH